jgi:hypothetical protein
MSLVPTISNALLRTTTSGGTATDSAGLESSDPILAVIPTLHAKAALQCMAALCVSHILYPSAPLLPSATKPLATLTTKQTTTPRKKLYPALLRTPPLTPRNDSQRQDSLFAPLPMVHILPLLINLVMNPLEHCSESQGETVSEDVVGMFVPALEALTALSHNTRYIIVHFSANLRYDVSLFFMAVIRCIMMYCYKVHV